MNFIAFDFETTGTVPGVDQIVEIGAVRFVGGQVDAVFSTLVEPDRLIPPGATAVNGITNDMVKGQPKIHTLLDPLAEFCGDLPMVAHNAAFDAGFLTASVNKFESMAPKGLVIDTLVISRKVIPGLPNYKLGTLVQHLKIPSAEFHRAEADAIYCGKLFLELVKRISVGGRPPELANIITLTGKPEFRFPQIIRQPKQMDFF